MLGKGRWFFFPFLKIEMAMCSSATFDSSASPDLGVSSITDEANKEANLTLVIESHLRKPEYSLYL